jgi:hypothetical protein
MRIRSTKPEFWRSERIASVSWDARLMLKGLESFVDDNGVGRDDLPLIVGDLFQRDLVREPSRTLARVSESISELCEAGLVHRYEAAGTKLLYLSFWESVQRVDKPQPGRFPRPDGTLNYKDSLIREPVANIREESRGLAPGTGEQGNRGTGEQGIKTPAPSVLVTVFDEAWSHWPKKVERKQALERFKTAAGRYKGAPEDLALAVTRFGDAYAATTDRQFVPALGVWLAGDRWNDELPEPRQAAAPGRGHSRDLEWQAQLERAAEFDRQQEQRQMQEIES